VPLLVVMGKCPTFQPSWGYGVSRKDICKPQPMRDVLQSLLQDGLTGEDLLHTLVSRRVQPLWRWEVTMWRYPWPTCPDYSFSAELVVRWSILGSGGSLLSGHIGTPALARYP
jgi:hypothetical protein